VPLFVSGVGRFPAFHDDGAASAEDDGHAPLALLIG
jgi:hypothetical protein